MRSSCEHCGTGWRFHALNCPTYPGEVLDVELDEQCNREEREHASFRSWLSKPGNAVRAAQIMAGTIDPTDPLAVKVRERRAEMDAAKL